MVLLKKLNFLRPFGGWDITDADTGSSFFKKTAWNTVASLATMVSRLLASIVIARSLGTDGTGWIAYLMWVSETAAVLIATGYPESLPRYLAELTGQNKIAMGLARWIFRRYLFQSIGGLILLGAFARIWMAPRYEFSLLWVFVVMLAARLMSGLYQAFLMGRQRFDLLARLNIFSSLALLLGVIVCVHEWGTAGALMGYTLGTLLPSILSFGMLKEDSKPSQPSRALKGRFWNYAFFIWISNILGAFVWMRMEVFFLHRYWSDSEVSMFSVPQTVAALILNLAAMLSGAFMPHFASLWGSKKIEKIHSIFGSGNRLLAFILFPIALGGAAIMPVLLPLFYGHKFDPAIPNTVVLFAASFITFGNISSALITGLDRSRFLALITLIAAILSALAGFTVIRYFGSWGAVWTRSVIQFGLVLASMIYISRVIRCPVPFISLGQLMGSAALCSLSAGVIIHMSPGVFGLILAVLSGMAVYVVCIRLIGGLESIDVGHLVRVLSRLPEPINGPSRRLLRFMVPDAKRRVSA